MAMQIRSLCTAVAVLAMFCLTSTASAELVSSWDFNEGSGTTTAANETGIDDATLAAFGTSGTVPTWVAGQSGASGDHALDFVGIRAYGGYASSPTTGLYDFAVDGGFSVATWLKMPKPTDTAGIVNTFAPGGLYGWGLVAYGSGQIKLELNLPSSDVTYPGITYNATSLMDDIDWFHVAVTYEGLGLDGNNTTTAALKFYINGDPTPVASTTVDFEADLSGQSFPDNPLYLGVYGDKQRGLTGSMDSVRIFDHTLTGDEVASLVPEPSTYALLAIAILGLPLLRRRRSS